MARFDPVGVSQKRLRKARAKTFKRIKGVKLGITGDIKQAKTTIRKEAMIRGNILDPFN